MDIVANRIYINREFYENTVCNFDWSVYYTARQAHIAMWQEVINMITTSDTWRCYQEASTLKCCALNELGFDDSYLNSLCFACTVAHERAENAGDFDICKFCPLKHDCYSSRIIPEELISGHYRKFCDAFYNQDIVKMVKYAEQIRDDWKSGGE